MVDVSNGGCEAEGRGKLGLLAKVAINAMLQQAVTMSSFSFW